MGKLLLVGCGKMGGAMLDGWLARGLAATDAIVAEPVEALLGTALDACERYFPAFQFVVWAGKGAREALDAAMFETQGQA